MITYCWTILWTVDQITGSKLVRDPDEWFKGAFGRHGAGKTVPSLLKGTRVPLWPSWQRTIYWRELVVPLINSWLGKISSYFCTFNEWCRLPCWFIWFPLDLHVLRCAGLFDLDFLACFLVTNCHELGFQGIHFKIITSLPWLSNLLLLLLCLWMRSFLWKS